MTNSSAATDRPDVQARADAGRQDAGVLSIKAKAGFSLGQVAGQLFRDVPSLLLLFYLTSVMRISPAIAGAVIFVPKVLFSVIFDMWVGVTSDRISDRFPRRRWLLIASVLAPFALMAPFAVPHASLTIQLSWILLTFSAYMAVYSILSVPYLAQFAEISDDPRVRTEMMTWRHGFTGFGVLLSSSVAPFVVGRLGGDRTAYLTTLLGIGIFAAFCLLSAWRHSPPERKRAAGAKQVMWMDLIKALVDRRMAALWISAVVMTVSAGLGYASLAFFVRHAMERADAYDQIGIMAGIMAVMVMVSAPFWLQLSRKIGTKNTYLLAAIGHGIFTLLRGIYPLAPLEVAYVLVALMAACNAGWGVMVLSLLSDAIARVENETGEHRAGSYSAIWSVIEKAGIALGGTLVVGLILSIAGFDSNAASAGQVQSASAIIGVIIAYSYVPGLAKLIAALVIWKYVEEGASQDKPLTA